VTPTATENRRRRRLAVRKGRIKICANPKCGKPFNPFLSAKRIYCCALCKNRVLGLKTYYRDKGAFKRRRAKYLASHVTETRASRASYRAKTCVERKSANQDYYRRNKARWINQKLIRRSRERTTPEERNRCLLFISLVKSRSSNTCYYCAKRIGGVPHIDHIVPLSKGGRHEVSNLCVSHERCNLSKQAKRVCDLDLVQPLLSI
jgi:5-methylcytosine-specific restriction endonuclease McrA